VVLAVVALSLSTLAPAVGGVPDARLTVDDATIAPDRPTTDEPTTVTADMSLSAGSNSPVELDRIALRNADGERLASADDPGSLSPGDGLSVDLVTAFETAGSKDLTVVASGTDDDGRRVEVERPVTVVVEDSPPGITVDADLVEDVDSPVTVTVANPDVDAVRNVEIVLLKGTATADRAFVPVVGAGGTAVANLSVTPTDPEEDVAVRVAYTTATGDRQRTVRTENLRAEPLQDDVGIDVRQVRDDPAVDTGDAGGLGGLIGGGGGGLQQGDDETETTPQQVEVAVTNFGNAEIREAVVEPSGEEPLARQFVGDLEPGETGTVTLDLTGVQSGELDVAVSYRLDRRERQVTTTYDYRPATAAITLTGVDMARDGDRLNVSGNAGNTGDARVTGVVVALGSAEGVRPTYPQRDYFVGTVDGSEFAPFELTATVTENASTVPVEVTYRVDGEERTERAELPIEAEPDDGDGRFGGLSLLVIGGGIAVSLAVGALVALLLYYLRR
jgi:hypothetical protein